MNTAAANPQIQPYLLALRAQLAPMTLAEREDIVREIAAHIQDSIAESGEPATVVLARLGSPDELAAQYNEGLLLRRASRSFSPLLLLRATLRIASKGVTGALVFFAGMLGYGIGTAFVLTALLKPIFPAHTGLWMVDGRFLTSGTMLYAPQPPAQEILGWWYVLIALAIGCALIAATTLATRAFLRFSRRLHTRLATNAPVAIAHII